MDPEKLHEKFKETLRKGYKWQLWVGYQLLREGFFVQVPKLKVRPKITDENIYTDDGDIAIKIKGETKILECKAIKMNFTCKEDFPRPKIIVDRVATWDQKTHKPLCIINICKKTWKMFVIFTGWDRCKEDWDVEEVLDTTIDLSRDHYMIDKSSHWVRSWEYFVGYLRKHDSLNQTND